MSADEEGSEAGEPEGSSGSATGTTPTEERVREALGEVIDPCSAATGSRLSVLEMGMVAGIEVESGDGDGDHVQVDLRLTSPMCHMVPYFYEEIEGRVGELPGVASATLDTDLGLDWHEGMLTEAATRKRRAILDEKAARYREEIAAE